MHRPAPASPIRGPTGGSTEVPHPGMDLRAPHTPIPPQPGSSPGFGGAGTRVHPCSAACTRAPGTLVCKGGRPGCSQPGSRGAGSLPPGSPGLQGAGPSEHPKSALSPPPPQCTPWLQLPLRALQTLPSDRPASSKAGIEGSGTPGGVAGWWGRGTGPPGAPQVPAEGGAGRGGLLLGQGWAGPSRL